MSTPKTKIEQTIEELKAIKDGEDVDQIRSLTERLQQASHALTQQMYQQQAADADGADFATDDMDGSSSADSDGVGDGGGSTANSDDDVVDGEFRQV